MNDKTTQLTPYDHFKSLVVAGDDIAKHFNENALKLIFHKHKNKLDAGYIVDYLHKAQLSGADPRLNQIYLIPRWDKKAGKNVGVIVWSYHFFMSIAASHSDFNGADVTAIPEDVFNPLTGEAKKELVATATVWRGDKKFTRRARWSEYYNEKNPTWRDKPYSMLEKCALSLAVRAAFPAQLNYMMTDVEMDKTINDANTIEGESREVINDEAKSQLPSEETEIGSPHYRFGFGPQDIRNKKMQDVPVERLEEYYDKLDAKNATQGLSENYVEIMTSIAQYLEAINA